MSEVIPIQPWACSSVSGEPDFYPLVAGFNPRRVLSTKWASVHCFLGVWGVSAWRSNHQLRND